MPEMRHNPSLSLSLFGLHSQCVKNGLHVSSFVSFQALHLIISLFSHPSSSSFSSVFPFSLSSFSPSSFPYTIHSILLFLQLTLTVHFAPSLSLSFHQLMGLMYIRCSVRSMFCMMRMKLKKHVMGKRRCKISKREEKVHNEGRGGTEMRNVGSREKRLSS